MAGTQLQTGRSLTSRKNVVSTGLLLRSNFITAVRIFIAKYSRKMAFGKRMITSHTRTLYRNMITSLNDTPSQL